MSEFSHVSCEHKLFIEVVMTGGRMCEKGEDSLACVTGVYFLRLLLMACLSVHIVAVESPFLHKLMDRWSIKRADRVYKTLICL